MRRHSITLATIILLPVLGAVAGAWWDASRRGLCRRDRAFAALAVLSLALFLGSTWLWYHAQWTLDMVQWVQRDAPASAADSALEPAISYTAHTTSSRVLIGTFHCLIHPWEGDHYRRLTCPAENVDWGPLLADNEWFLWNDAANVNVAAIGVPFWLLCLAFACCPTIWFIRRRRAAKKGTGRCTQCGYDLRATPDRCPECGAIPVLCDT